MASSVGDALSYLENLDSKGQNSFLNRLTEKLSRGQQKSLLRRFNISPLSLCKDIIGNVPAEIAQAILRGIDADYLVAWRRVSRRWNAILSDEAFCQQLRRRFEGLDIYGIVQKTNSSCNAKFLRLAAA